MEILYLKEHLSCLNYRMNSDLGFSCHKLDKDDVYLIDNSQSSCTLFVIQGEVIFTLGKYEGMRIIQKEMLFIPQNMKTQFKSVTASRCILLFWDKNVSVCDKLFLSALPIKEGKADINDGILPIRSCLMNVLESVNLYMDAKLLCKHMHLLKQQEILLVLRGFYTKKELSVFFSSSTYIRKPFERFVLENYTKIGSIKEFAHLCNMSERSFNRNFHSSFGQSPYQWLQRKKAEQVEKMIGTPEISFKEIAEKLGFNTPSHFTAYCQKVFGMSPTQLREEMELKKSK